MLSGFTTSRFWISLLTTAIGAYAAHHNWVPALGQTISQVLNCTGLIIAFLSQYVYVHNRTLEHIAAITSVAQQDVNAITPADG